MRHSQDENFLSNWINSFALKIVRFKAEIQILLMFAKQGNTISNLLECLYNYEVNGLLQAPIFRKNWLIPLLGGHLPIKCEIRGPANSIGFLCESGQIISEQLRLWQCCPWKPCLMTRNVRKLSSLICEASLALFNNIFENLRIQAVCLDFNRTLSCFTLHLGSSLTSPEMQELPLATICITFLL